MKPKEPVKRLVWKAGRYFSISLREGYFALLMMLDHRGKVAIIRHFNKQNSWKDHLPLRREDILFFSFITKDVWLRSEVFTHLGIAPIDEVEYPGTSVEFSGDFRHYQLWDGTAHEREILSYGNDEVCIHTYDYSTNPAGVTRIPISKEDFDQVHDLELINLRCYPEFNERLFLCAQERRNIDPLKELYFNRNLSSDYVTFVDIISGKVRLSTLGY